MGAEARSVVVRLSMDSAQAIASARAYGTATTQAMAQAEAATARQSKAVESLAGKAAKGGLILGAAVALSGKAAMDWESQWAGVEKTVDGTAGQMAKLEGELRGLAKTMPATHAEIAATAEAAGQLGVAREDVAAFTKTMLMLGETTNLTSEDAATQIAQFMNVMKTGADEVDEIGNTLVDLGNKGASTEAEIMAMAQRLAGAGHLVGATEADTLALASAMANLGIQSELGGGAMQRTFSEIYEAASAGEEGLTGFADVAGMTASDFAESWSSDPVAAFDAFIQGLGRIQAEGGNVVGTLRNLGLEGTQNLQVLLRLAGSGDMLTKTLQQSRDAWGENSALTTEYGKRAETTAAQVQIMWNRVKDAGIEAGEALLPVMKGTAAVVGTAADAFAALPDPLQEMVVSGTALAAVTALGAAGFLKLRAGVAGTRAEMLALEKVQGVRAMTGVFREAKDAQRDLVAAQRASRLETAAYVGQLQSANRASALGLPRSIATQNRLADSLTKVEMAQNAARYAGERASAADAKRAAALRSMGSTAVRTAVPVAALAAATTGVADGMGLSNTATMALMGSVAGPWGAVIGGGVGVAMDFAGANDDLADALERANELLSEPSALADRQKAMENAKKELDEYKNLVDEAWGDEKWNAKAGMAWLQNAGEGLFGKSEVDERAEQYERLQEAAARATAVEERVAETNRAGIAAQMALSGAFATTADSVNLAASSVDEFKGAIAELNGLLGDRSSLREYEEALDELAKIAGRTNWDPDFSKGRENLDVLDGLVGRAIKRSQTLKEAGNDLGSVRVLQRAIKDLQAFGERTPAARRAIRPLLRELRDLTGVKAEPEVRLKGAKRTKSELAAILAGLTSFDGTRPDLSLDPAKTSLSDLLRVTDGVNAQLDETGKKKPRPKVGLDGAEDAAAKLRTTLGLLQDVDGFHARSSVTTTNTTITRTVAENMFKNKPKGPQALGGFHTAAMAEGSYEPVMMGPGDTLYMWREPETKGESFIPHADDHRRPRAKSIAEQTVELFGGHVVWNARGNHIPVDEYAGLYRDRLGPVAAARPTTGWQQTRGGHLIAQRPARVTGTVMVNLRTPWGEQEVEGLIREVARDEIDTESRFRSKHKQG